MFKKNFQKQAGFTFVELLVSISIIALMSALFFANYRGAGIGVDLSAAAQEIVSRIRVAQNYSLGTKKFNNLTPLGGWGVYFDYENTNNEYIIFADLDGDYIYDTGEEYSTSYLPRNVIINSMSKSGPVNIVFLPPDPRTYINGEDDQSLNINLKEEINNTSEQVQVNFLGLIDVSD